MATGREFRLLRFEADLQQLDVAAAANLPRWRIREIEYGRGAPITIQEARAIRTAIQKLSKIERKRRALLAPGIRASRRIPRRRPKPRNGAAPGEPPTTCDGDRPEQVPAREESPADPVPTLRE
jgi:hypothetical protein